MRGAGDAIQPHRAQSYRSVPAALSRTRVMCAGSHRCVTGRTQLCAHSVRPEQSRSTGRFIAKPWQPWQQSVRHIRVNTSILRQEMGCNCTAGLWYNRPYVRCFPHGVACPHAACVSEGESHDNCQAGDPGRLRQRAGRQSKLPAQALGRATQGTRSSGKCQGAEPVRLRAALRRHTRRYRRRLPQSQPTRAHRRLSLRWPRRQL